MISFLFDCFYSFFTSRAFLMFFVIQGAIAVALVKWAIGKTEPLRTIPDKIPEKFADDGPFAALKRDDAKKWNQIEFYIVAFFLLFFRIFTTVGLFTCFCLITMYLCRGLDKSKPYPDEIRRRCQWHARWMCRTLLFFAGWFWIDERDIEADYSEYLGPNYDKRERPSLIVANHTSWVDIVLFMYCKFFPSFVSKEAVGKVPLVKEVGAMLNCYYIDREATKENKNKIIEDISQRQSEIDEGKDKFPLIIFPEGTTSNGLKMMEFKRGAFAAMKPVKPITVKYRGHNFHPTYEILPFPVHVILMLSQLYSKLELLYLPIFVPNKFMVENTKFKLIKNEEMIFAETVRTVMEENSGIGKSNTTLGDKKELLEILYDQKGFS